MKHPELIQKMTNEEKASILSGMTVWQTRNFDRLDLPSIFCSDGPHGLRKQAGEGDHLGLNASLPATCFPTAATIANSWDESLGQAVGEALGEEASAQKVNVLLGPGLNMKRSPLCGRNFEYFAEDPYLAGKMAASYIRGIQSKGRYACPKHFAVNSQELRRMAVDEVVDERTLREIYLTGFEIAVKEGKAKAIMSAYNMINEHYANESKHLLVDILRDEWGFDGIVITDWGGSNDHTEGVKVRSNLEMPAPGLDSARQLLKALEEGRLSQAELDQCADDLVDAVLDLSSKENLKEFDVETHHALAHKAAVESAVLLKNAEKILPLKENTKVALIGDFAETPRYQGAGSSVVNPTKLENMAERIKEYPLNCVGVAKGYLRTGGADDGLKQEALELASKADVVIYCFGLDELSESEGLDRTHMKLPQNQIEVLHAISKVNPNVVGVISAGSSIEMPWETDLKAILHCYLYGQAGPGAALDLLTGKHTPCGKLNESYPMSHEDSPAFSYYPSAQRTSEHREGMFIGYRYYNTANISVRYPFGFGLSYTTFEYSDLSVNATGVTFTIKNTGDVDGAEIAELYVGLPGGKVFRPAKELKGFKKVFLKAGESQSVTIAFDDKTFRYWNVKTNAWEVEEGQYRISIGASVEDIRLDDILFVAGTTTECPYSADTLNSYYTGNIKNVSDEEFKTLLGHEIPDGTWSGELGMNDAFCQLYYSKSWVGRLVYRVLTNMKTKSEKKGTPDLNILFIYNMPFRGIAKMTGGAFSMEMSEGLVTLFNGHFFKGLGKIIAGKHRNGKANKQYEAKLKGE